MFLIKVFRIRKTRTVHLVIQTHGIAPTFLKLDSWSPEAVLFLLYPPKNESDK